MRLILPKKSFFIFLIVLFFSVEGFSQTIGDYRSKNTSGNWTTASDWQYYNGSSWVNATTYPGQNTGTGVVLIQAGHTISVSDTGISTQSMGTLTVSGKIILNGKTNATVDFSFNTQTVIVTPYTGEINFQSKISFILPSTATLQVIRDVSLNPDYLGLSGDCNHNQDIYIGTSVYAYCNGGGSTGLTFQEVMAGGGTINAVTSSNSPVCQGNTINLSGSYTGVTGTAVTYSWLITDPNGGTTTTNTQNPTITNPIVGTYTAKLTCSTTYNSNVYSNSETIFITVNSIPTVATIVGGATTVCVNSTTPAFTNATSGGTWSISNCTGTASITTGGVVTGLTAGTVTVNYTVSNGTCSNTVTKILTVNALPTAGLTSSDADNTFCSGTSVTFTATGGTNYDFRVGGSSVQNGTSSTYTSTALTNGQVVDVVVTNTSGCTATSLGITNTVNALPTAGLTSSDADNTFCTGTSVTFTATGGTNYNFRVGSSSVQNGTSSTYTTTVLTNGQVVDVIVTNASGCSSISSGITNTVNSLPSAPTIVSITQPNCTLDTGSVVLSDLPSTGTWTLTRSGTSSATTTGTGSSTTISGLIDGGSYTFTVSNGTCTSNSSDEVDINDISTITSTWSGSSWINGVPDNSKRIVFSGNFSSTEDIVGCSCRVTSAANVVINSGHTLKVTNGVEVQPNAKLIFENDASLVQMNDAAVNSGNINYKRHTGFVKRYDFTYWSSPVTSLVDPQTLKKLSPNTLFDKYYSYSPTSGWKIEYNGTAIMEKGRGYIIRAPQTFSITVPAVDTAPEFVGVPNNGLVSYEVPSSLVNLIGNPYPSAIDADKFIAANSTSLEGTLYFWTHNTSPSKDIAGDAIYNYTTNDYVTYNKTGGVNLATGKIAAGQSFFAPSTATGGTVVFNNAMRYTDGQPNYDNSQFYKLISTSKKTAKATAETEKSRIWLNLTNKEGAYKQMLIGYIAGATNDYDRGFDGVSYDGNQYVDFYSVNQGTKLSIQGRAVPFVKQDSVALGYKSTIVGEFQISIDHTDGVLSSQNVFLEDKDLNILHDLKKGAYTFSTIKGTFKNRFVLRYVDKNAVEPEPVIETPQLDEVDKTIMVSVNNNEITVSSSEDLISKIIIYDVSGKIIYQKENVSANDFVIQNLLSSQQLLLVSLVLENGKTIATKVLY